VNRVQVRIYRYDDLRVAGDQSGYYNPATGSFEPAFNEQSHLLTATYDRVTRVWTLVIRRGTAQTTLPSGNYFARVTVTDNAGNAKNERVAFRVDTVAPPLADLRITSPQDRQVYTTLTEVRGTARDDASGSGIARVGMVVYRYANAGTGVAAGYLGEDGAFGEQRTELDAAGEVGTNGAFNFTFVFTPPLDAGRYFVQAIAEDRAGNRTITDRVLFTIRNTGGGTDDFIVGQTYLISFPYMDSGARLATTTPNRAFNIAMVDPVTGDRRYQLNRFDPVTQTYVLLEPNDILRRGEGYFLKPLTANVRMLRTGDDPTRFPLAESVTTFQVTLRRNPSANPQDQSNGFNLIGNPFNPERYLAADWVNATVEYNGVTYASITAAASAGIVDSRLFTFDANTNGYQPVNGNMEPFKGYFVKTFYDGVKVNLKAISTLP
jgi:hypothetical protein